MLPPQVPMPRPATTPPTSVAADQFHALAALPPAIEWFLDITNTNTRRA
jgi:hypothetical protein